MKKILITALVMLFAAQAWAAKKETEKIQQICPTTKMTESCLSCHTTPNFKIKESDKCEGWAMPSKLKLINEHGIQKWYYVFDEIEPDPLLDAFRYIDEHNNLSRQIVIEINSPGGHVFNGWRCVNIIMSNWDYYEIETRLLGMAFSAGFLVFNAGEVRTAARTAEMMTHEASFVQWGISLVTPSSSEDTVVMMRHLQDNANAWLASRTGGKVTKEELDIKIKVNRAGWWFNGVEGLEYGFVDKLFE